jgi:putative membrane protein
MQVVDLLAALQPRDRFDHMAGWQGGWMWVTGLVWLLMIVALTGLVVWLVLRTSNPTGTPRGGADSARRILAERFARGEIDEDEYIRRRDLLG